MDERQVTSSRTVPIPLSTLPSDIQEDLQVYQRDYSSLRRGNSKWTQPSHFQTAKQMLVQVQRRPGLVESCDLHVLYYRAALKRHPILFKLFQQVWRKLNPFHIKLLSRRVLQAFNEYLLNCVFSPVPDSSQSHLLAARDTEVDLKGKQGLTFSDFYDSLFEAIDNWTRSKLVMEYALVAKKIGKGLDQAVWLNSLELHNKAHISTSPQRQYSQWMFPLLSQSKSRHLFLSAPSSPNLRSHSSLPAPPHLSQTLRRLRPAKDAFLTQVKTLASTNYKSHRTRMGELGNRRRSGGNVSSSGVIKHSFQLAEAVDSRSGSMHS